MGSGILIDGLKVLVMGWLILIGGITFSTAYEYKGTRKLFWLFMLAMAVWSFAISLALNWTSWWVK